MDERAPSKVVPVVQLHAKVPEDRRKEVVVVPPYDDRLCPLLDESQDLLDLHPLIGEVLRELVLEVAGDDQLLGLVGVEEAGEPLEDLPPLKPRNRYSLLRERGLEPQVEVADRDRVRVLQPEREMAGRPQPRRDLDLVHGERTVAALFGRSAVPLAIEKKERIAAVESPAAAASVSVHFYSLTVPALYRADG